MSVWIDIRGDRIWLESTVATPGLSAAVPGAYFSEYGGPHWTFPLRVETCLLLRERFGEALKVKRELADWYRVEIGRREAMAQIHNSMDVKLQRVLEVAPLLAAAMEARPYQPAGAMFAANGKLILNADEQGLGKTLETLGGIVEANVRGPYLVVCPKTAVEAVWAREIPRWVPGQEVITVPDGAAKRTAILDELLERDRKFGRSEWPANVESTWLVVHPELLRTQTWWVCKICGDKTRFTTKPTDELSCGHPKVGAKTLHDHNYPQLFSIEWGAVVADECHDSLLKLTGTPNLRRRGMEMIADCVRPDGMRIAISGTPMRGKPHNLWSILNWLYPRKYRSKWAWIQSFWETGGYTGYEIGKLIPEREAMLWESLKDVVLRRTKQEVAQDLPPKSYGGTPFNPADPSSPVGVWLPMSPAQKRAYNDMERDAVAAIAGGQLDAIGILAQQTRLKQFASSAGKMVGRSFKPALPSNKFDWLVQKLDEIGFPNNPTTKVVVVSEFTELLGLFARELGDREIESVSLTGAVTGAKRAVMIERFNRFGEGPHLMFLQIKTGGVAITIDTADIMIMLDEAESDAMQQVEDRIHRVSNPRPVTYWYLRSVGTIDVGTALVNAARLEDTRRLMDSRRGVEYMRRVLEASHA